MSNDHALLGNLKEGLAFVVSAPAGTGKTTLVHRLLEEFSCVSRSISCTTREPRRGETPGIDYDFIDESAFKAKIAANEFLKYAKIYGQYYGTCKNAVGTQQKNGQHVVMVIDTQGAMQIRKLMPAVLIFIQPPSLDALKERLEARGTESPEGIAQRFALADKELSMAKEYDYVITNAHLPTAYEMLRSIFIAEECRVRKK